VWPRKVRDATDVGGLSVESKGCVRVMRIGFDVSEQDWVGYDDVVKRLASRPGVNRMLDIGGGANPTLKAAHLEAAHLEECQGER